MNTKTIGRYFQVLGLKSDATLAETKEAYRFLVQSFHEDKYPADHPYRDVAREKMVALNEAYEELKKFFQEHPEGLGACASPNFDDAMAGAGEGAGDDDAMDWQDWQRGEEQSWSNEAAEWLEKSMARHERLKEEERKKRRQALANTSRWTVVGMFVCMTMSCFGDHSADQQSHRAHLATLQQKLRYDLDTHGTATSCIALSDAQIVALDGPAIRAEKAYLRDQGSRSNTGLFMLVLCGAALAWLLLSRKAGQLVHNYVEGKPLASEV